MTEKAEGLIKHAIHIERRNPAVTHAFVAQQQDGRAVLTQDQQGLFKARVVAAEIGDIGGVFAVAIDEQSVVTGLSGALESGFYARLIGLGRDVRLDGRQSEFRQFELPPVQLYASTQTSMTRFCRVPIPSMVMVTLSSGCSVKSASGTIPAPVSKMAPPGYVLLRPR